MAGRVLAALAAVVLLTSGPAAQAPAQPTFRSGVTLLTIDVAVLDGDWRPRPGLTADDFEVELEGRRQAVKTLDYLDVAATQASAPAPAAGRAAVAPAPLDRTFLLFVDDLSFAPLEHRPLVAAAERFVATLRAADRVGVMTSSGRQVVAPTLDRAPVVRALGAVTGTFASPQREAAVHAGGDRMFEGEQIALSEAVRISRNDVALRDDVARREGGDGCVADEGCLRAIEFLAGQMARSLQNHVDRQARSWVAAATALGRMDGARVLVAISAGLPADLAGGALREFGRPLTRAGVAVHVLGEPRRGTSADDRVFAGSRGTGQDRRGRDNPFFIDGLRDAAAAAGGAFHPAVGQVDDDFARVLRASGAKYRLGIELPAAAAPGAVQKTRVRVKGPGLRVLAASEYTVPGPPPVLTTDEQLRAAIGQGQSYFDVPLSVTPLVRRQADGAALELALHMAVPLTAAPPLDVVFAVIGDGGRIVQSGRTRVDKTSAGEAQAFALALPVPPGTYRVRVAVADGGGRVGSSEQVVPVRLVKMGGLLASQMFARAAGAGGWTAELAADLIPDAATHLELGLELYRDGDGGASVTREAVIELRTEAGAVVAAQTVPLDPALPSWSAAVRLPTAPLVPGRYALSIGLRENGVVAASVARGLTKVPAAETTTAAAGPAAATADGARIGAAPAAAAAGAIPGVPARSDVLATLRADAAAARPAPDVASLLEPRAIVAHLAVVPGAAPAGSVPAADLPGPEFFAALARYAAGASGARADVARGLAALHRQDWAAAVAALEQALDTAPDALVALRYLGAASAGIGEDRDAAGAWALSLTGADVPAAWVLAHAHALVRAQDLPGALTVLTDGVARWPADAALLARRGELLIAAGRPAEARVDLEAAVDRAPGHDRALFLLTVLAFADVAGGAGADAVAAFDRWSARYLARPDAPPSPVADWRRVVLGRAPR